jgi:putative flippase GtrA
MKELLYNLFLKKTSVTKLQFFRYLFVGGFAAGINIGSLYIFKECNGMYYLVANVIGFLLGLIVNYILSKLLIFTEESNVNKTFEFVTYAIIGILGLGFDTLFMWFGTSVIGIYYMLSKIISTGIVFIWNFFARKILYIMIDKNNNFKK